MDERSFRMEQVTVWRRGGRLAADRLSFGLGKGERVLLAGEEPEDVRALFETAAGLEKPQEGRILVEGRKAFLPEQFPYLASLRAVEYLLLPQLVQGIPRARAWENVRELVKESGLWEIRTNRVSFLTEYEKSLLMIAAAFSIYPEILIAGNFMYTLTAGERKAAGKLLEQWTMRFGTAVLAFGNAWNGNFPFQRKLVLWEGRLREIAADLM
ncbi:MAG TPA: hypothetical protein IAA57_09660 [Candidatus Pullilachnospira intestinigallinarum]|nr:hypothetical protein [Candidatus Pullilachnospira intestinigallinarum]